MSVLRSGEGGGQACVWALDKIHLGSRSTHAQRPIQVDGVDLNATLEQCDVSLR